MRGNETRLLDPLNMHQRIDVTRRGVRTLREIDEDNRTAQGEHRSPAGDRKRITGSLSDNSLLISLINALRADGLIDDRFIDLDPEPAPIFENNAGLMFRGAAPSIAGGAAGVIGTGASISLANATDNTGQIVLTTGTGISTTGLICTITFVKPKANDTYAVLLSARESDASSTAGQSVYCNFATSTTTDFPVAVSVQLANSTSYRWDFQIIERVSL